MRTPAAPVLLAFVFVGAVGGWLILAAGCTEAPGAAVRGPGRLPGTLDNGDAPRADPSLRYAHTVVPGENLSVVAARAGVTVEQIVALNRLENPERVRPGAQLILRPLLADGPDGRQRDLLAGLRPEDVRLEVRKAGRRLTVRIRGALFRSYRIALGGKPDGDKRQEGDGRTPEGEFFVCQKNPDGRYGPSLGLSYPDAGDAERGRRDGLITAEQYQDIVQSIAGRRKPPWDTPLGGAVCIHGRGSSEDWTAGCLALDDADASELFALTPMNASVRIAEGSSGALQGVCR